MYTHIIGRGSHCLRKIIAFACIDLTIHSMQLVRRRWNISYAGSLSGHQPLPVPLFLSKKLLHHALGKLRPHFQDHLVSLATKHLEKLVEIEFIFNLHAAILAVGLENVR